MRRSSIVLVLLVELFGTGCQEIGGYDDFSPGAHPCDVLGTKRKIDENRSATNTAMVLVESEAGSCFWIDEREVSVQQYETWFDDMPSFEDWDANFCLWKASLGRSNPTNEAASDTCYDLVDQSSDQNKWAAKNPMRCVDFCDAKAFCKSYGADLCRTLANTSWEPQTTRDEFVEACNGTPTEGCNLEQADVCSPPPLGTNRPCGTWGPQQGPGTCRSNAGAFDMLGNTREWVLSCLSGTASASDGPCRVLGGSFLEAPKTCATPTEVEKRLRDRETGFRCCAKLTEREQDLVAGR